jgi:RNA polymerase sigma factor (sigma-70 family)
VIAWVGSNVVPHEADLRARLRKLAIPEDEIWDMVQDTYLRISQLESVEHIRNPKAYFFAAAQSVLLDGVRRRRIVRIDSMTEADALKIPDDDPGPERRVSARVELARVRRLVETLPERCRTIFEMRRIQGTSQREISAKLGVPEYIVEAQAVRGLKLILKAIAREDHDPNSRHSSTREAIDAKQRR